MWGLTCYMDQFSKKSRVVELLSRPSRDSGESEGAFAGVPDAIRL
jgi:hypothetical protein